jgi:TRAP-type C4-dicarboxylate transport system substrate-binding protein
MKSRTFAALALLLYASAAAGAITIKLGSLAPTGSPFDLAIRRLALEWQTISAGTIVVRTYSGGIAGDEPDMVRKMRFGQLGAAAITVSGLNVIYHGIKAISFPLFIRTDGELEFVLQKMRPYLEPGFEKSGFKVMMWSPGGWVYFFSRYPIEGPDDLKKQKLWVWAGDPNEVQAWQAAGFQVVPLASTDIMTSLQSGMIDAFITSPLIAAANQWFGIAKNMCNEKLGPLWGALAVSMRTWNEIPPDLRPKLEESAQRIADTLGPEVEKADQEAITVMKKYGLNITQMNATQRQDWAQLVDKGFSQLIGKSFDPVIYDMAKKYLDEYLALHPRK